MNNCKENVPVFTMTRAVYRTWMAVSCGPDSPFLALSFSGYSKDEILRLDDLEITGMR